MDILQREFNLKQEQFYQDPTAALKQQYSREDLDKTQSQIDAKKQDVEKDKQAISDLEDELRRSGGDPGWANEPSGAGPSDSSTSESGTSGSGGPAGEALREPMLPAVRARAVQTLHFQAHVIRARLSAPTP